MIKNAGPSSRERLTVHKACAHRKWSHIRFGPSARIHISHLCLPCSKLFQGWFVTHCVTVLTTILIGGFYNLTTFLFLLLLFLFLFFYWQEGFEPLNLYVEDEYDRASRGGAGGVKSITNYAPVSQFLSLSFGRRCWIIFFQIPNFFLFSFFSSSVWRFWKQCQGPKTEDFRMYCIWTRWTTKM